MRKTAIAIFSLVLLIGISLTVIGAFFRGPGWAFVVPWDHLYLEL